MIRVKKIAHAVYEMPDVDKQTEYYTEVIGLTLTDKSKDAAYLASTLDHHSVVLRKGSQAKCVRLGFQIAPEDDLGAFEKQVQGHGIKTQRLRDAEPSISDMVTFEDPKGTVMEAFKRDAFSRDHHTINLMQIDANRHFHTAFELRDWGHLQTACDFLSLNGYKLIWGPGRHGIGHNLFAYHRAPNGLITELFAELDQVNEELGYFEPRPWHRDRPQKPKVWPKDPSAANLWGIMPPDEMMK